MIDSEELRTAIAANVSRLRASRGWQQKDLADRLQISVVMLSRIENGHSLPGAKLLFAIADVFGVSADSLRQVAACENFSAA